MIFHYVLLFLICLVINWGTVIYCWGQSTSFYLAHGEIDKIKGVSMEDFLTFNRSQIPRLETLLLEIHSNHPLFFRRPPAKILHLSFAELPLFNGKYVRLIFQALNEVKSSYSLNGQIVENSQLVVEKFKLIYAPIGKKYGSSEYFVGKKLELESIQDYVKVITQERI